MSFNTSSFSIPNTQHSVSRQAHPLPLEGLGEAVTRGLVSHHIPPYPLTSPPSEGLGEAPSLWFWAAFFGACFVFICQFLSFLLFNLRPFAL